MDAPPAEPVSDSGWSDDTLLPSTELLSEPFVQLPFRFDAARLRAEVEALPADATKTA